MDIFLACFIPLFVAIDPLGAIPIYVGMTEGMPKKEIARVIALTILTALILALAFMFLGKSIFNFLGISVNDFKIGGGIILLLIALEMVLSGKDWEQRSWDRTIGVVPLGVPLIVGPASITTLLIQMDSHPLNFVMAGLITNLIMVALVFMFSGYITRLLGTGGMKAMSKLIGLFLAAIAVMMIRVGIQGAFKL